MSSGDALAVVDFYPLSSDSGMRNIFLRTVLECQTRGWMDQIHIGKPGDEDSTRVQRVANTCHPFDLE